jgi:molybdate transport system substrate-binding protein
MRFFLLSLMLALFYLPAQAMEPLEPKPNLTILSDDTLLLPLAQIARAYAIESQTPLTIVVKNAQSAQQQIEQGLEAHLLITADYTLIDQLSKQGVTDVQSRKTIARTQLALVTANDLGQQASVAKRISFASILAATANLPVYANSPDLIDGERAFQLLKGFEFSDNLRARLEPKASTEDVITALRDAPSLGLIFATQTVGEPQIRVVSLLPDEVSPPVNYDVVVLGSELTDEAKAFANYLGSRTARTIFARFGYQPPSP